MTRDRHKAFGQFIFAGVLVLNCSCASAGPTVWIASSLQAVGLTDPAGTGTLARIWAGRREYESFQIVVKAQGGSLNNVNVTITDLAGPGGFRISSSDVTLYREHYSYVSPGSPDWGGSNRPLGPGWYADGLIPFLDPATGRPPAGGSLSAAPFQVASGQNQPIWVDVFTPASAPAGSYSGTYTVSSGEGSVTGAISLTVWNFTLPATPSLLSSFGFAPSQTLGAIQEVLRHKIAPMPVNPADEKQLMMDFGLPAANLRFWSGASAGNCVMSPPPSVDQLKAAVRVHQPGLFLSNFTADEVDNCPNLYSSLQQWGLALHQAGARQLVTMKPVPQLFDDGSGSGRSAVDIWVMLPVMYTGAGSAVATVLQKGDAVWSANAVVQDPYSPKWELDFRPADFRLQPGFISQSLQLSGLLYWRLDNWTSDPWINVNNVGVFGTNNYPGEGYLVYPGADVGISGVVPSVRLKRLRDGFDDFEYIELLKKAGQGSWALQIAKSVGPDWVNWTRDAAQIESARFQLGQELDRLASPLPGGNPLPGAPANPSPANGSLASVLSPTLSWTESGSAAAYDVYFGTSPSPSLVATTTTTQYTPNTLGSNQGYYWRVVARGSSGLSASSPLWSFTTQIRQNVPPQTVSVNPASGTGSNAVWSFVFADPNGFKNLRGANVLIGETQSGVNNCWLYFDRGGSTLWLADDSGSSWSSLVRGGSGQLGNSQCTIGGAGLNVSGSGNTLTMNLQVSFKSAFAGKKSIFMNVSNAAGLSSGYSARGSWTVPAQAGPR